MVQYLLLISGIITIAFTTLVSVPGSPYLIGGMTQADISNMFSTSVTPAGFTFSIWSIIYISWIIAGIYVAFFQKGKKKIGNTLLVTFSLAIGSTAVWLVPWGNIWIGTALIVMIAILVLLKYTFYHTRNAHPAIKYSVELTLGWINIATVANITIWLVSLGFRGGSISEIYWAIGVLGLALILTAYYQCRYHAYIVSLVFLWTMLGEWVAHPVVEQRVAVIIFALVTVVNMYLSYRKK